MDGNVVTQCESTDEQQFYVKTFGYNRSLN